MIYLILLLIVLFIIFIHELGHYSIARLFKAIVTDFSIGFGKVLFKIKDNNHTTWKFSVIPLGGYVRIKGLESIFRNSGQIDSSQGSFENLNIYKKICILLAGSFFNILSALLCLFCIFFFLGIVNYAPTIGKVLDNTPAKINDLKEGDTIVSINNKNIQFFNDIPKIIKNVNNVKIELIRKNKFIIKEFDLLYDEKLGKNIIGISSTNNTITNKYEFFSSLKQSIFFIKSYYVGTYNFLLKSYADNTLSESVAGPIGMVKIADQLMLDKLRGVLFIFISISLFVGLMNLLPIPLLDGGHIMYFILRSVFSNSLPVFVTKIYLIIGVTIISFLFLIITFNDIFYK
tara:strand:+ start:5035 stop:6069 length:1035 start_codon:yes stop_codon:yes gene_type:complete